MNRQAIKASVVVKRLTRWEKDLKWAAARYYSALALSGVISREQALFRTKNILRDLIPYISEMNKTEYRYAYNRYKENL